MRPTCISLHTFPHYNFQQGVGRQLFDAGLSIQISMLSLFQVKIFPKIISGIGSDSWLRRSIQENGFNRSV